MKREQRERDGVIKVSNAINRFYLVHIKMDDYRGEPVRAVRGRVGS